MSLYASIRLDPATRPERDRDPRTARSRVPVLPDGRRPRREPLPGVLHHVHLQVRPVRRSVRAEGALMHRLFTALVYHVPPQVLHLVVTPLAVVAGKTSLAPRSSTVLGHAAHVVPHFRVICNQEKDPVNSDWVGDRDRRTAGRHSSDLESNRTPPELFRWRLFRASRLVSRRHVTFFLLPPSSSERGPDTGRGPLTASPEADPRVRGESRACKGRDDQAGK